MRERLSDYQEEYGDLVSPLRATPAESTAYRLAKHTTVQNGRISRPQAMREDNYPLLHQLHLPVDYTEDIFSALDIPG